MVCGPAESLALAGQLQREIHGGHALHGRTCIALARRESCDEVLFYAEGASPNLATVKLTWRVPREEAGFPWTTLYSSLEDWSASAAA